MSLLLASVLGASLAGTRVLAETSPSCQFRILGSNIKRPHSDQAAFLKTDTENDAAKIVKFADYTDNAPIFSLDENGLLKDEYLIAVIKDSTTSLDTLRFETLENIIRYDLEPIFCDIRENALSCSSGGGSTFQLCNSNLAIGDILYEDECQAVNLSVSVIEGCTNSAPELGDEKDRLDLRDVYDEPKMGDYAATGAEDIATATGYGPAATEEPTEPYAPVIPPVGYDDATNTISAEVSSETCKATETPYNANVDMIDGYGDAAQGEGYDNQANAAYGVQDPSGGYASPGGQAANSPKSKNCPTATVTITLSKAATPSMGHGEYGNVANQAAVAASPSGRQCPTNTVTVTLTRGASGYLPPTNGIYPGAVPTAESSGAVLKPSYAPAAFQGASPAPKKVSTYNIIAIILLAVIFNQLSV